MKNTITIKTTEQAIIVTNGKAKTEVPYVSTAKGVKWFVTKGKNGDYISMGFKVYANGEVRCNLYLHDYGNKFASLKTADGKALETIAKATPMTQGKKYTITNLSGEGLRNFAVMFADFEKSRQADSKADSKAQAQAKQPKAQPKTADKGKAQAQPKADSKTANKGKADKPKAQADSKPKAQPKAQAQADKPKADSKPQAQPQASTGA